MSSNDKTKWRKKALMRKRLNALLGQIKNKKIKECRSCLLEKCNGELCPKCKTECKGLDVKKIKTLTDEEINEIEAMITESKVRNNRFTEEPVLKF
tara:strand:+ start:932 stop:1219 length:288 start_codon:yes stop_codon:yes gene_type:complete